MFGLAKRWIFQRILVFKVCLAQPRLAKAGAKSVEHRIVLLCKRKVLHDERKYLKLVKLFFALEY